MGARPMASPAKVSQLLTDNFGKEVLTQLSILREVETKLIRLYSKVNKADIFASVRVLLEGGGTGLTVDATDDEELKSLLELFTSFLASLPSS